MPMQRDVEFGIAFDGGASCSGFSTTPDKAAPVRVPRSMPLARAARPRTAEQHVDRLAEQRLDRLAGERREVVARLQDVEVVGDRQQIAVRLDAAGDVDRLGVAVAVRDARFERAAARFSIGQRCKAGRPFDGAGDPCSCERSRRDTRASKPGAWRPSNVAMAAATASSYSSAGTVAEAVPRNAFTCCPCAAIAVEIGVASAGRPKRPATCGAMKRPPSVEPSITYIEPKRRPGVSSAGSVALSFASGTAAARCVIARQDGKVVGERGGLAASVEKALQVRGQSRAHRVLPQGDIAEKPFEQRDIFFTRPVVAHQVERAPRRVWHAAVSSSDGSGDRVACSIRFRCRGLDSVLFHYISRWT